MEAAILLAGAAAILLAGAPTILVGAAYLNWEAYGAQLADE